MFVKPPNFDYVYGEFHFFDPDAAPAIGCKALMINDGGKYTLETVRLRLGREPSLDWILNS